MENLPRLLNATLPGDDTGGGVIRQKAAVIALAVMGSFSAVVIIGLVLFTVITAIIAVTSRKPVLIPWWKDMKEDEEARVHERSGLLKGIGFGLAYN